MKKIFLIAWLLVLLTGISLLFYYNEWKYSLPTPVPSAYNAVNTGEYVNLDAWLKTEKNKPVFIHFFNPSCPCSKFNIPHFKSLVKRYGDRVSFAIVVLNKDKKYTAEQIQERFDMDVPVLFNPAIATACGVYSTPQAVLLDTGNKLYYRGNYNRSRYCTDKNSNYAQQAIDTLLNNNPHPVFSQYATKAYGCQLPDCTR